MSKKQPATHHNQEDFSDVPTQELIDAVMLFQKELLKRKVEIELYNPNRREAQEREIAAKASEATADLIAKRSLPAQALIFELAILEREINTAVSLSGDTELKAFLKDKGLINQLSGKLADAIVAYNNVGFSLATQFPAIISRTQAYIVAINEMIEHRNRAPLVKLVTPLSGSIADIVRDRYSDNGNLKRDRELPDENVYIGERLLDLEGLHTSKKAVQVIINDLEAEREIDGSLSAVKNAALILLRVWTDPNANESTFRANVKRCKDRAVERQEKMQR